MTTGYIYDDKGLYAVIRDGEVFRNKTGCKFATVGSDCQLYSPDGQTTGIFLGTGILGDVSAITKLHRLAA